MDFLDALEQLPNYLVLCTPIQRVNAGQPTAQLGFRQSGNPVPQWVSTERIVREIKNVGKPTAVVLVTIAAQPSRDAFRGTPLAARQLGSGLDVPVIFVCHTPGIESFVRELADRQVGTFVGILLDALSRGKDLDRSVYFARERVLRQLQDQLVPTLGVPAFMATRVSPSRDHGPRLGPPRSTATPWRRAWPVGHDPSCRSEHRRRPQLATAGGES